MLVWRFHRSNRQQPGDKPGHKIVARVGGENDRNVVWSAVADGKRSANKWMVNVNDVHRAKQMDGHVYYNSD